MENDAPKREARFQGKPDIAKMAEEIRRLASNSENVFWTKHARERMIERGIPVMTAHKVLREGQVYGEIMPGQNENEWKAKMVRNAKGNRDVGVVCVVKREDRLVVLTVEWEDLK
ncbi:DUF4258 domain-containing protein [Maritalea porphyrae]|uniref:DUF4258 domain-containing protein n=1 Tax=Maritalea porphyrae TaxID=880732 RepID=A0ABQ5UMH5_9HYPH|nr:DUF4258 domain-containing protein [Maritalea porphyrae]GLQ15872.1 hypothetical protein GCM10007879_01210 [Maritalea porphyrae]